MKPFRANLNAEMRQLKSLSSTSTIINFHRLIQKQQEVIASLHEEVLMLKSYITLHKSSSSEPTCAENSTISTNSSNDSTLSKLLEDSLSLNYKHSYDKIIREIVAVLELKEGTELDDPRLLDSIRQLKEISVKKHEPIFVERVKEIKVPITVEKIIERPVEKIVEKIVYVEKGYESRDPWQRENEEEQVLNKTYSDRNLNKTMKPYREEKYQERYQEKSKYEPYRRNDTGNPLIKKRAEGSKYFGRKDYY